MARRDITGAVDFAYLERYAAGDLGVMDEVLALFQEQAAMWSRMLEGEGAPDALHTLKGSGRGVGAFRLADACEAAEEPGLDEGTRAVRVGRVRDELERALADIAAYAHERALQGLRSAS